MSDPIYLTEARRLEGNRQIRFAWTDGHEAEFEVDYLRGYCPCALCQGHDSSEVVYHPPKKPVSLIRIEPVGNYAINLTFSDQHATGIYRFDFLRGLCPCPQCQPAATPS